MVIISKHKIIFIIIFYLIINNLYGQIAPDKYLIRFTDKNGTPYSIDNPEEFLSERAINRRIKQEILLKENDLPINPQYTDSLINLGVPILNKSKWFNSVTIDSISVGLLDSIENLSFVESITKKSSIKQNLSVIRKNYIENINNNPLSILKSTYENHYDYGFSGNQINMLNGHILHNLGYTGKGIQIAVLDAGFSYVNSLSAFDSLWENEQIICTYDYVDNEDNVFEDHSHGMWVLSIISANIPGELIGVAPKAEYLLFRTEDGASEYLIEEENWIAAAEYADSAGVDIITSSLGYSHFTDISQNHTYADMDGNTTRISIGADIAASKGILVVISAGNEALKQWKYISAPADGDSVLAVGAVDKDGIYAEFSSIGPSYDGRVKPNVVAQGKGTYFQNSSGTISSGNGTSFSAPIIAGLSACLWQANPDVSNMEIFEAVEKSANLYSNSNSLYGYGIPDFDMANKFLKNIDKDRPDNECLIIAYPNPFENYLDFDFNSIETQKINIDIYNIYGQNVFSTEKKIIPDSYYTERIVGLNYLNKGLYILKISAKNSIYTGKLIKR
ncbi:MAG: S8 family serine peptidase [Bacteroidales bacterium]|nr:S8 family serine peptidase [Bacteroidales bacterium]